MSNSNSTVEQSVPIESRFKKHDAIGDFEYGMLDGNNRKWAVVDSTSGKIIALRTTIGEAKDFAKDKSRERKARKKQEKAQMARG